MMKRASLVAPLLLALLGFAVPLSVSADLLCAKKNVKPNKKGKVALAKGLKTTSESSCPRGFVSILDTSVFKGDTGATGATGAAGAAGAAGADGLLNLDTCVWEQVAGSSCAEGLVCTTTATCGSPGTNGSEVDDLLLTWEWANPEGAAYITSIEHTTDSGGTYPTAVAIKSTSEEGFGAHTPEVWINCCLP